MRINKYRALAPAGTRTQNYLKTIMYGQLSGHAPAYAPLAEEDMVTSELTFTVSATSGHTYLLVASPASPVVRLFHDSGDGAGWIYVGCTDNIDLASGTKEVWLSGGTMTVTNSGRNDNRGGAFVMKNTPLLPSLNTRSVASLRNILVTWPRQAFSAVTKYDVAVPAAQEPYHFSENLNDFKPHYMEPVENKYFQYDVSSDTGDHYDLTGVTNIYFTSWNYSNGWYPNLKYIAETDFFLGPWENNARVSVTGTCYLSGGSMAATYGLELELVIYIQDDSKTTERVVAVSELIGAQNLTNAAGGNCVVDLNANFDLREIVERILPADSPLIYSPIMGFMIQGDLEPVTTPVSTYSGITVRAEDLGSRDLLVGSSIALIYPDSTEDQNVTVDLHRAVHYTLDAQAMASRNFTGFNRNVLTRAATEEAHELAQSMIRRGDADVNGLPPEFENYRALNWGRLWKGVKKVFAPVANAAVRKGQQIAVKKINGFQAKNKRKPKPKKKKKKLVYRAQDPAAHLPADPGAVYRAMDPPPIPPAGTFNLTEPEAIEVINSLATELAAARRELDHKPVVRELKSDNKTDVTEKRPTAKQCRNESKVNLPDGIYHLGAYHRHCGLVYDKAQVLGGRVAFYQGVAPYRAMDEETKEPFYCSEDGVIYHFRAMDGTTTASPVAPAIKPEAQEGIVGEWKFAPSSPNDGVVRLRGITFTMGLRAGGAASLPTPGMIRALQLMEDILPLNLRIRYPRRGKHRAESLVFVAPALVTDSSHTGALAAFLVGNGDYIAVTSSLPKNPNSLPPDQVMRPLEELQLKYDTVLHLMPEMKKTQKMAVIAPRQVLKTQRSLRVEFFDNFHAFFEQIIAQRRLSD